jgi:leader peptidase (prepilin peptidase)/N-methyltransferase
MLWSFPWSEALLLSPGPGAVIEGLTGPAAVGLAVVVGLLVGSFLNVVVYRVPRGLSVVQPGSFCPSCGAPIGPLDNVPLASWLVLRGRCRRCHEPISPRYPLVELATGVLFGLVAWGLGPHWAVPGTCALGATALASMVIELDGMPPAAPVVVVGTALGDLLLGAAAVADRRWWHLAGVLVGTAALARRGRGGALPWAVLPVGALLGWVGGIATVVGVAVTAAGVVVLVSSGSPPRRARRRRAGLAVASAVGSVAAVIAAVAAGSPIGR